MRPSSGCGSQEMHAPNSSNVTMEAEEGGKGQSFFMEALLGVVGASVIIAHARLLAFLRRHRSSLSGFFSPFPPHTSFLPHADGGILRPPTVPLLSQLVGHRGSPLPLLPLGLIPSVLLFRYPSPDSAVGTGDGEGRD